MEVVKSLYPKIYNGRNVYNRYYRDEYEEIHKDLLEHPGLKV